MFVEQRIYTTLPGKWRDYLALYEAEGLPIQLRILGRMVGYYTTEIGGLNQIVHMWAYTDMDEREQKRTALLADEGFRRYVAKMLPLLQSQESRILRPTRFFTPQWQETPQ
ncbi:NIPSNAP family protein [Pandoraea cepalis]|uniref:NIPSNAP family protein n=1 Tax=Pandoraea cepalis TaxID=2508294 RepID=A0AAW7MHP4_9BURK|nr:NIPSNAP family protein [Pandoraea cepalis]MDN4572278.1 NIPSNAP family protein [Pandoraea cepalis]MDN4576885.1 NIPSNAP family protein [Pandoraea cepalis]